MRRGAFLLIAASAVAWALPASAAELLVKAPVATGYSWTGCYVGAGAGWLRNRSTIDTAPTGGFFGLIPSAADRAVNSHRYDFDGSGFAGGPQVGCNLQIERLVLGLEADFSWSSLDDSVSVDYGSINMPGGGVWIPHGERLTHGLDWFATLRERVGFTWNRTFVYATGGLAYGSIRSSFTYTPVLGAGVVGDVVEKRLGWTVGAGLEFAFDNRWTAKLEYLHLDFGEFSYDAPTIGAPAFTFTENVRSRVDVVRFGINYRWQRGGIARF